MIKFKQWNCIPKMGKYPHNKQPFIILLDSKTAERIAVATVCLANVELAKNETAIKDYSENEGMLKAVVDAGIVKDTGRREKTGHVYVPIVEML